MPTPGRLPFFRRKLIRMAGRYKHALNRVFYRHCGGESRPVFHDVETTYSALKAIDENFDVIREELQGLLEVRDRIPKYHEVSQAQTPISAQDERAWRVFFVYARGLEGKLHDTRLCPRTAAIVGSIPNVFGAFFSILEPRKCVPAHCGPYLGYLRYHTALVVPKESPPSIRIKDRHYTWEEGKSIFFDDSWEHEVYNECDGTRVCLIVDVMRPMPWPLHLLNATWEPLKRLIRVTPKAAEIGLRPQPKAARASLRRSHSDPHPPIA